MQPENREATFTADQIVDIALSLAEQRSWEALRLHDVAVSAGISLDDIRRHFREKEDLVDAWFDRADQAMLRAAEAVEFQTLPTPQRLHRLIMTWLEALAPHRQVTRQMILGKLEPGHLHIQIPALMRVSRTVQWIREAAQRDAMYLRRALEETGLTSIYLMTFVRWMWDESPEASATRRFLERRLAAAATLSHWVFGDHSRSPPGCLPR
jgi:AcrR family transcriptional regulator